MDRVLVDSSYLYALYSPSDNNYQLSQAFAATNAAVALDRRDFSIFRPRHCEYLELLP